MLRHLRPAFLALTLLFTAAATAPLAGCSFIEEVVGDEAPAPQTSREVLVSVEYGFQAAVDQAGAAAEQGLLVGANAKIAEEAIVAGSIALDRAHEAEKAGGDYSAYVGAAAKATADILNVLGR